MLGASAVLVLGTGTGTGAAYAGYAHTAVLAALLIGLAMVLVGIARTAMWAWQLVRGGSAPQVLSLPERVELLAAWVCLVGALLGLGILQDAGAGRLL